MRKLKDGFNGPGRLRWLMNGRTRLVLKMVGSQRTQLISSTPISVDEVGVEILTYFYGHLIGLLDLIYHFLLVIKLIFGLLVYYLHCFLQRNYSLAYLGCVSFVGRSCLPPEFKHLNLLSLQLVPSQDY